MAMMALTLLTCSIMLLMMPATGFNPIIHRRAGLISQRPRSSRARSFEAYFTHQGRDDSPQSGMELISLVVPVQDDPGDYLGLITGQVPRHRILKWYVSRVEASMATIEVVVFSEKA